MGNSEKEPVTLDARRRVREEAIAASQENVAMPGAGPALTDPFQEERRRSPRAALIVRVECKRTGDYVLGRSQDVSEGGLSVLTSETFDPQAEVVVRFKLPPYSPGIPIESSGVVVHARPGEQRGVQFLQLSERQREALARYVQQAADENT